MSRFNNKIMRANIMAAIAMASAFTYVPAAQAEDFTAGVILKKMTPSERFTYVAGIVEGMAYARFRKDTLAKGAKDGRGSACIRQWLYSKINGKDMFDFVEENFARYPDYTPAEIIGTMVKKKCGE